MQVVAGDRQRRKRSNLIFYTVAVWTILLGGGGYLYYSVGIDSVTESIQKVQDIPFLLVVEDAGLPVSGAVLLLNTANKTVGMLDIPAAAGNLLTSLQRSDRYAVVYQKQGWKSYRDLIAELVGMEFDFTLKIELSKLVRMVDLLGGLELIIPSDVREKVDGRYYWLDTGVQQLDGDKVAEYLTFPSPLQQDAETKWMQRQARMLEMLASWFLSLQNLSSSGRQAYARRVWELVDGDIDRRSFLSLVSYLSQAGYQEKSFVYQRYLGNERTVQGKRIIFPMYNGELLRERMKWVKRSLASAVKDEGLPLEILNGTARNRLASNAADIYRSYGYRVVQVGNSNIPQEKTVITSFTDSSQVEAIAELINCDNIEYRREPKVEGIEVRIVLGKDFNGRYVIR